MSFSYIYYLLYICYNVQVFQKRAHSNEQTCPVAMTTTTSGCPMLIDKSYLALPGEIVAVRFSCSTKSPDRWEITLANPNRDYKIAFNGFHNSFISTIYEGRYGETFLRGSGRVCEAHIDPYLTAPLFHTLTGYTSQYPEA